MLVLQRTHAMGGNYANKCYTIARHPFSKAQNVGRNLDCVVPRILTAGETVLAQSLSIFDPASPGAHSIVKLAILAFVVTGLIFVVVEGVLLFSVWRFRGQRASTRTSHRKFTAACRSK